MTQVLLLLTLLIPIKSLGSLGEVVEYTGLCLLTVWLQLLLTCCADINKD